MMEIIKDKCMEYGIWRKWWKKFFGWVNKKLNKYCKI